VNRIDVVAPLVDERAKLHAITFYRPGVFDAHQIGVDPNHTSAVRLQIG
jgi:hypothetical protein